MIRLAKNAMNPRPRRIYALAKELKVESKELVEVCIKAGIRGKGSALANLTEEEVEKVKQFLKDKGGHHLK
jgi:translation initiation factor IF-2